MKKERILNLGLKESLKKALLGEEKSALKKDILPYTPHSKQREWIDFCFKAQGNAVRMVLAAREYGKTDCICILGISEELLKNPDKTFIVMSRTLVKSRLIVKSIAEALLSQGVEVKREGGAIFVGERAGKQPSVLALSLTSSLKMYHCDVLILDDPLDPEDEISPLWQRRAHMRWEELSGAIAKRVIVTGQYVCENDLYCFLEQQTGVETLKTFRGDCLELDELVDKRVFVESYGLYSSIIERFEAEGKSYRWIAKNYLGLLVKDDSFAFKDLMIGDFGEPYGDVFAYLDPSFTGRDATALSIGWMFEGKIVVLGLAFKQPWDLLAPQIADICHECGVKTLTYEGNSLGFVPDDVFCSLGLATHRIVSTQNKHHRIYRLSYGVSHRKILLHEKSNDEYKNQVLSFKKGCLFDDAPDSMEGLITQMGF